MGYARDHPGEPGTRAKTRRTFLCKRDEILCVFFAFFSLFLGQPIKIQPMTNTENRINRYRYKHKRVNEKVILVVALSALEALAFKPVAHEYRRHR